MRLSDQLFLPRLVRTIVAPRVASGALLIAIAMQLSVTTQELLAAHWSPAPKPRVVAPARSAASLDSHRIVAAHLFGGEQGAPPAATPAETAVALSLRGVIATVGVPERGSAIAGPEGGATRMIRVGGDIIPGITLRGVYPDHIVLSRDGALEALALPHGPGDSLFAAQLRHPGASVTTLDDTEQAAADVDDYSGPTAEQVSQKLVAATAGLSQVLTATGAFEGVAYKGVRVQPGSDPELFAQLGFHPGDLILDINGMALNDPAMLAMLKSGRTVRVGVRRISGTEILSIDTAALRGSMQN